MDKSRGDPFLRCSEGCILVEVNRPPPIRPKDLVVKSRKECIRRIREWLVTTNRGCDHYLHFLYFGPQAECPYDLRNKKKKQLKLENQAADEYPKNHPRWKRLLPDVILECYGLKTSKPKKVEKPKNKKMKSELFPPIGDPGTGPVPGPGYSYDYCYCPDNAGFDHCYYFPVYV